LLGLRGNSCCEVANTLGAGVSEPYSSDIQAGKFIPHPRHWQALAELAGVTEEGEEEH
jgi:hypothetical protein